MKEAVAALVRRLLAEEGQLEDNAAYHVGDDVVDFWVTPTPSGFEIELPKFVRDTYDLEVA